MSVVRRWCIVGLLVAGLAILAACDGSDGTAQSTTATVDLTAAPTVPPATSSISTVPASTTATTSAPTVAPTTTIDEIAATKAAVAAAAVQNRQDYQYALENYDAPDALDVLARTTAVNSPSWNLVLKNMETLRANGWRSRPNPEVPSVAVVEGEVSLIDGPPATRAELTICVIDSDVLYEPGGVPGGADAIVNDEITANRDRVTMVLENGAWKLFEGTNLGTWNGVTACPVD